MMLHRHQEGDLPASDEQMTKLEDVIPHTSTTDPNDPLYIPVEEPVEEPKRGRKKNN